MSSPSGTRLAGRYELVARIGSGGFSEVWRAADSVLGRPVAVKLLHPGFVQHAETLARFRAEAQHAGRLAHENIARVYDYGEADPPGSPFLVMELVDGPSLADKLAAGPVSRAQSIDILAQAAAGLQAAHAAGLVHRDIKPGNLLLAPGGVVKITDFGISHAAGSAPVTSSGLIVGTAGYLAPERVAGARATPASDLYSLGVVAYECLTGGAPFAGMALEVALAHRDRPFPDLPGSVPAEVAALVTELTAKDPARRPAHAREVARRARELTVQVDGRPAGGAVGPDVPPARADRPAGPAAEPTRGLPAVPVLRPRRRGRRGRAVALAAAAIVAAAAGLVMASVIGPAPAQRPAAVPSASGGPPSLTTLTVDVNGGSLAGQPVSVAVRRLRQQGLQVRVVWQYSREQPAGMVVAVAPAGRRPVGSLVTVTGALAPGSSAAAPLAAGHGQHAGQAPAEAKGPKPKAPKPKGPQPKAPKPKGPKPKGPKPKGPEPKGHG